jgi:hypothetical protein
VIDAHARRCGRHARTRFGLALSGALAVSGCFYDFSLNERDADYCTPQGYRVALCDRFERTRAFSDTLHESFTASPSTVVVGDRGRALVIDPPDDQQEWVKAPTQASSAGLLLAFRLRVVKPPAVDYRILFPIKFTLRQGGEGHVFLRLEPGGALSLVDEYQDADGKNHSEIHAVTVLDGNEHSFRIELDVEKSRIAVELDGDPRMPAGEIYPWLPRMLDHTSVAVFVGAGYAPRPASGNVADAAVVLRVDDVLFAVR